MGITHVLLTSFQGAIVTSRIDDDYESATQDAGVRKGNGDGTVPLVSLGLHCRKGWRTKALNPAGFSVVTHELKHDAVPMYQDPRHAAPSPLGVS